MPTELNRNLMQEKDLLAEINPHVALEKLYAIPTIGLSIKDQNWLNYYQAKALVSLQQFSHVENLIVECLEKAIPDRDYGVLVLGNILLSICYRIQQSFAQEKTCLELATEYATQSGDFEYMINARSSYLSYLRVQMQFTAALKEEQILLELLKQVTASTITINALMRTASLQMELKRIDKAIRHLREALLQAQTLNIHPLQLTIINNLATAYSNSGETVKTEELLKQGLQVAEAMKYERQIVLMLFNLGNLKLNNSAYEEALVYYNRCKTLLENSVNATPQMLMDLYNNLSLSYWRINDKVQSILCIDKAIQLAKETGMVVHEIEMNVYKTNILTSMGKYDEAQKILVKAAHYYKQNRLYPDLIEINNALADLYAVKNDYKNGYKILIGNKDIYRNYISQLISERAKVEVAKMNSNDLHLEALLPEKQGNSEQFYGFVGISAASQQVLNAALLAAQNPNANVLIIGESGTGKEIIAHLIHHNSLRRSFPFVSVNIASLAAGLVENELFGHSKGAFTGADTQTKGFFLKADTGTFFLDEISEFPIELQSKLLRVIETRKVIAVGSSQEIPFDCRIISATNQNIHKMLETNKFRLDLFHRLNTIEIHIPPLRERPEDIEPLLRHYIEHFANELKKPHPALDSSMIYMMRQYSFPGNVRELRNIIERMFILGSNQRWDSTLLQQINPYSFKAISTALPEQQKKEEDLMIKALLQTHGKQKEAAKLLGMSEATFCRRVLKYNIQSYTKKGR